ncbi:hypothetical protein EYF80_009945 [Liparis tanakae]|uniref:Uncharacterized protein n=1 Tax=Liparis tanakae TaxID=230148 RepID=A0A4Z2IQF4_9TELE|nr:hypothetical protein EYF80_009945 [Liparis tanakae]
MQREHEDELVLGGFQREHARRGELHVGQGSQVVEHGAAVTAPLGVIHEASKRSKVAVAPSGIGRNLRVPESVGVLTRPILPYRAVWRCPLLPHNKGGMYLRRRRGPPRSPEVQSHSLFGQHGAGLEQVAAERRVLVDDLRRLSGALQVQAADDDVEDGRHRR